MQKEREQCKKHVGGCSSSENWDDRSQDADNEARQGDKALRPAGLMYGSLEREWWPTCEWWPGRTKTRPAQLQGTNNICGEECKYLHPHLNLWPGCIPKVERNSLG